jgi:hypothetical protein
MTTKEEVESFLTIFRQKLKVYSIVFRDDRNKNLSTLALSRKKTNNKWKGD